MKSMVTRKKKYLDRKSWSRAEAFVPGFQQMYTQISPEWVIG